MNRARLYVLIDALEEDLRDLITKWIVSRIGEAESLGPYAESARQSLLGDPSVDPETAALTDYLYLQETTAILNSRRDLLPTDVAQAIRRHTPQLDLLSPVRNRVMHGRPLQPEDASRTVDLGNALLATGLDWPNLADVLSRLHSDPDWEPTYLPRAPLRERVMHNLPLPDFDETGLVGRAKEVRDLLKRLIRRRDPVTTVVGEGGVGKTALAVKVLYDLIDHPDCPYDAVLWTSLKSEALTVDGIKPLLDGATGLRGMVSQLATPIDETFEGTLEELSEVIQGTESLIVVDNLETADSSEVLRLYDNLPDTCSYLFTSRVGLGQLERRAPLGPLGLGDASALFRQLASHRTLGHLATLSNDAVASIVNSLRRNPLALKWYVLSVGAGHEPDLALENQDLLLEFCVRSVFESLSGDARDLLLDIYSLDRPILFSELAVLSEEGGNLDLLRRSLHELQRSSLVEAEAEIGDRVSQAFALSESAKQFLSRVVPTDEVRRAEIRARDQQLRTRSEARRREGSQSALAPHVVHARSHLDAPIVDLLSQALTFAHEGDERWRERIATAERLAPGYFEVPRVHAFIESTAGRVENATALYEKAMQLAEGQDRAVVAYFFAGHLARTAMDPAAALEYAAEASNTLGEPRARVQHGSVLMYLQRFDEARPLFEQVASESDGRTRLIAITSIVSLERRRSEWIREQQHNPLLAAQACLVGLRRGMAELSSGVRDRRLTSAVVHTISNALSAFRDIQNLDSVEEDVAEVVKLIRLNERHWKRVSEWGYVQGHLASLKERSDLPHSVSAFLDEEATVRLEGLGERHEGTILRLLDGGYGFIQSEGLDALEVYFHISDLASRFDRIFCVRGVKVDFLLLQGGKGPYAKEVSIFEAERRRLSSEYREGILTRVERNFAFAEDEATRATVFMVPSSLEDRGIWRSLTAGNRVQYMVRIGQKGPRAARKTARLSPQRPSR